jgi:hypothetical protein
MGPAGFVFPVLKRSFPSIKYRFAVSAVIIKPPVQINHKLHHHTPALKKTQIFSEENPQTPPDLL